jgi:hypothetical protein
MTSLENLGTNPPSAPKAYVSYGFPLSTRLLESCLYGGRGGFISAYVMVVVLGDQDPEREPQNVTHLSLLCLSNSVCSFRFQHTSLLLTILTFYSLSFVSDFS